MREYNKEGHVMRRRRLHQVIVGTVSAVLVGVALLRQYSASDEVQRGPRIVQARRNDNRTYFVQATNSFGRYSNMRIALLRSASIASYLNRTLVFAPFANCLDDESVQDLFDMSHIDAVPTAANLKPMCRPAETTPAFMLMRRKCPRGIYLCPEGTEKATTATPKELLDAENFYWLLPHARYFYEHGAMLWRPRYANNDQWSLESVVRSSQWDPTAIPRCVGVQETFYFGMHPTSIQQYQQQFNMMQRMVLPSKRISKAVDNFLRAHRVHSRPFAGMHLRLTDIGGKTTANGLDCSADVYAFIVTIKSFAPLYPNMPTLLATDNETSSCTQVIVNKLSPIFVKSGIWKASSCMEAAFVQEVLARASAFVGVSNSTFSRAIEGIREHRHRYPTRGYLIGV
jgi:hypothetical protein